MKYMFLSIMLLALTACSVNLPVPAVPEVEPQANFYGILGGVVDVVPSQDARNSAIVLDSTDKPVIAWSECFTSCQLYVKRWNGTSWGLLGSSLNINISQPAINPSLVLDNASFPVVSWEEVASSLSKIYVKRWNGSTWVQVGAALNTFANRSAKDPSLALDTLGNPIVGFSQRNNNTISPSFDVRVKRWNGSTWTDVGVGVNAILDVFPERDGRDPSLTVDNMGHPVVSWTQRISNSGSENIYVKRWNGTNWIQVGSNLGSTNGGEYGFAGKRSKLILDPGNNPIVAIRSFQNSRDNIHVVRWNRGDWLNLGNALPLPSGNWNIQHSLAIDDLGNPIVSATQCTYVQVSGDCGNEKIKVSRWNSTTNSWIPIGTDWNVDSARGAIYSDIAIDSNNRPVVSFQECAEYVFDEQNRKRCINYNVYARGYFRNAFQPFGKALDEVIASPAITPSIAKDNNDQPVVAWQEGQAVRVSRWIGGNWVGFNAVADWQICDIWSAATPSLVVEKSTVGSAFNPVMAFTERVNNSFNICVRRWNGTSWVKYGTGIQLDRTLTNIAVTSTESLALDNNNLPYVAFTEIVGGVYKVYVKRWTGTAWVWVGGNGTTARALNRTSTGSASEPSIAIGTDNIPVVVWQEDIGTSSNIYVKRLIGTTWTQVGSQPIDRSIANNAYSPSLELDSSNNPVVVWQEFVSGSNNIYAKRWDAALGTWVSYGNALDRIVGNSATSPSVSLRTDDKPVVSWSELENGNHNIYVKRWTGSNWVLVSSGALDMTLSQDAENPAVVLNAVNNPIVTWQEFTIENNSDNIYVKGY